MLTRQPWFRVASILVSMNMLDAAERSITKGLILAKDAPSRKVFTELRATAERARVRLAETKATTAAEAEAARIAAAKAAMCFTHLLPPDILLLIAKAGAETDASMPLRMACVCADWRSVMLSHSPLWSHVKLGRRRPVAKLALWKERSNGRLKRVTITHYVPKDRHAEVADILAPLIGGVEEMAIAGAIEVFMSKWWGRCRRLKTLVVRNDTTLSLPFLCALLHPDASELQSVDWSSVVIPASGSPAALKRGYLTADDLWLPNPTVQLKSLRKLRIGSGQVAEARMWLPSLLEHAPNIREVELGCTWAARHTPTDEDEAVTLPTLSRLELRDMAGMPLPSAYLNTPNLTSFSCFGWTPREASTIDNLRGPGLTAALPNLVSLDIGRCGFSQDQLLALLPELVSLRFLNVSFGGLDNNFLEALVVQPDHVLLPSLTALSIAGHDNMSAGPLRRMVLSRHPDMPNPAPRRLAPVPPPQRSAFAPVRRKPPPLALPSSQPEPERPEVAAMTWVCVDQCNHPDMDVRVLEQLRKHLRFVSNHNGVVVEDRIRGRGAYAWDRDSDWDETCAPGSGGCHLRKRRGECLVCARADSAADSDGWYVHHTCKRAHIAAPEKEKEKA